MISSRRGNRVGAGPLAHYRAYLLNRQGRIARASDMHADDDRQAIELVRLMCEPGDVELWCGNARSPSYRPAIRL